MEEERAVALHEAAHAVVALKLGRWFDCVSLPKRCISPNPLPVVKVDDVQKETQVQLAGPIADDRNEWPEAEQHWQEHLDKMRSWHAPSDLGMSREVVDGLWQELRPATKDLVDQNWSAIRAVATALQAQHALSNEQVRQISSSVD
jgi:hypothetical protein